MIEDVNFFDVQQMARYLGTTEGALRSAIQRQRRGEDVALPPPMKVKGRICWSRTQVEEWVQQEREKASFRIPGKVGRPRKTPELDPG